ncbi:hypothetical protein [Achromobacter xylosoxidans]|jgi:hypothetical protein|uniref:hypothetical protein n=1 Tax=Alcaligenes xylosoxydans xylosoxydans TaxID=85698 RepID=UPI00186421ED|nr:hypothetical protein [Achromobacter xylosoxidans]
MQTNWNMKPRNSNEASLRCLHLLLFLLRHLLLVLFFPIAMGLDGQEHARAQHEDLERTEDYRDPKIHHFLKTLRQQLQAGVGQASATSPMDNQDLTAKLHTHY